MKKNRTMRVAVLMLALTLITCCFVGSTFAKYASEASGTIGSVTVANWEFKVNDTDITENGTVNFELFDTANMTVEDTKDNNPADDATDYTEGDVRTGFVAPGTKGSFAFNLKNSSDVTVAYTIDLACVQNGVPIKWSLDGNTWENSVDALVIDETLAIDGTKTITVYWMWAYGEDVEDNIHQNKVLEVTAEYTATQVD